MINIVSELRRVNECAAVNDLAADFSHILGDVLARAADEIERLHATIEQLRLVAGPVSIDAVKFADIKKFAKNPVLGEFTDGKP